MPAVGADGYANPLAYNAVKADWIAQGGSASAFTKKFGYLKNPDQTNHPNWDQYN